jgi:putative tryptophan/tyrosine transport system substrate-binding protein
MFDMKRREFITLLGGAAVGWPLAARAQQTRNVYRIGFLGNSTAALEANLVEPFREGLRDLGYVEGQNILIEYRWAEGEYERFLALIADLIDTLSPVRRAGAPTPFDAPSGRCAPG